MHSKPLFETVSHSQDDLTLKEEYKDILGEPDNIIKSIVKGFFYRWVKHEKEWADKIE